MDALQHLSADSRVPKTLASLSRYERRKHGLDVADSARRILATGVVVLAGNLAGWLSGWTRRDLLTFLHHEGVGARNSFSKERLAEMALAERAELLRERMAEAGVVELAPEYTIGRPDLAAASVSRAGDVARVAGVRRTRATEAACPRAR